MSLRRQSLNSFLNYAKTSLKSSIASHKKVTFVIGNESADLDSLTSSVLYAYLRSYTSSNSEFGSLHIPVVNIPAKDIQLRPEFQAIFGHANVTNKNIITLDDLPDSTYISDKLYPEDTRWILVDHNSLQGFLGEIYKHRVVGTIDHHEDEHQVPEDNADEPRIIQKCGSCTSLVTLQCRQSWDSISMPKTASDNIGHTQSEAISIIDDEAQHRIWDAQIAKFALSSILIDTQNLTSTDKVTDEDVKAVEYLEAKINIAPQNSASYDRKAFFTPIVEAKGDIGSLSLEDILRKDYKEWTNCGMKLGISCAVKPVSFLMSKANSGILAAMNEFARARELALHAIMTASTSEKGEFQRELLVMAVDSQSAQVLIKFSEESGDQLGLEEHSLSREIVSDGNSNSMLWRLWRQKNVRQSRKQISPMLREAMN